LAWLDKTLRTPLRKIVCTHMPPEALADWSHTELGRELAKKFGGGFKGGSRRFTELMTQHKVERVYAGHLHGFGVAQYHGVRYVLTGGGGSPLYPWRPVEHRIYNFIWAEVDAQGRLNESVFLEDGSSIPIERFPVYPTFLEMFSGPI
jgi:hypothetical protein